MKPTKPAKATKAHGFISPWLVGSIGDHPDNLSLYRRRRRRRRKERRLSCAVLCNDIGSFSSPFLVLSSSFLSV